MNTGHNKRLSVALLSAAMLSTTSLAASAATEFVRMSDQGILQTAQSDVAAQQLRQVLDAIATARSELKNTQSDKARDTLMQAEANMQKLTSKYGNGLASVYISSEHKTLNFGSDDAKFEADTPTLHQLDNAEAEIAQGEFNKAVATVDKLDYPLAFVSVDVPLQQTQSGIKNAIAMIESDDTDKAAQALQMAADATSTSSGLFDGDFNKS